MQPKSQARFGISFCLFAAPLAYIVLMNAVCMLIRPQLFDHPHWGISYFGAQKSTLLPYYLGYAIIIAAVARITYLLRTVQGRWRPLHAIFFMATILAAGIAATSYAQGGSLAMWVHLIIGLALLLLVIATEVWVFVRPGVHWLDYLSGLVVLGGGAVTILSMDWAGVLGLYPWGEAMVVLGTLAFLGRAALRAVAE